MCFRNVLTNLFHKSYAWNKLGGSQLNSEVLLLIEVFGFYLIDWFFVSTFQFVSEL
jgi:hypothetical protein